MYRVVLAAFPARCSRTRTSCREVEALLAPGRDRVSLDAPIRRAADVGDAARSTSSRRGSAACSRCFEIYEWCAANGVAMYGGGMGELGVGRGQIELLAALFHPDTPNDVAPSAFNAPELAAGRPAARARSVARRDARAAGLPALSARDGVSCATSASIGAEVRAGEVEALAAADGEALEAAELALVLDALGDDDGADVARRRRRSRTPATGAPGRRRCRTRACGRA